MNEWSDVAQQIGGGGMRVFLRVLVVIMTVGVLGAGAATAQHGDAEWIEAANQQFSDLFAAGDADALGMRYTVDAIVMGPNANPIEGREAITANFKEALAAGGTLRLTTDEVEIFGDVAHEVGRYVQEAADGSHVDHGKYIVIWKQTEDGWKLYRDIFNSNMASSND